MPAQITSRLDILPNEILEMVMTSSGCITALHGLVTTNRQANALFSARPTKILLRAMHRSGMETHIQALFCTIISIRQYAKHNTADESFRIYVKARLQSKSTVPHLDLHFTPPSARIEMLKDAAEMQSCLAAAENSFLEVQLRILTTKIQAHMGRKIFSFSVNLTEMPPSTTELHRVRRALWRLALYFEAYFEPYIPLAMNARNQLRFLGQPILRRGVDAKPLRSDGCCDRDDYDARGSQGAFFHQLTVWELEELECVWYHLSHQTQAFWHRTCPFCQQLAYLPDQLFGHIRDCKGPQTGLITSVTLSSRRGSYFQDACSWFRPNLEIGLYGKTTEIDQARWPQGPARESSAGFRYLWDNHVEIRPHHPPPTIGRDAWREFVYWGYAIWDQERLEECRLVDASDGERVARLAWWRSADKEQIFRGECLL